MPEVRRQQVEVRRIHASVEIKIAVEPAGAARGKTGGQKVEIDRVHREIEIRVAVQRVTEKDRRIIHRQARER